MARGGAKKRFLQKNGKDCGIECGQIGCSVRRVDGETMEQPPHDVPNELVVCVTGDRAK